MSKLNLTQYNNMTRVEQRERLERLSNELNNTAYRQQLKDNGEKRLKQFVPCAKTPKLLTVFFGDKRHLFEAIMEAAVTPCVCHPDITMAGLEVIANEVKK